MITHCHGNILQSRAEVLVNPVNARGVSGRGLALAFKVAYPENFEFYKRECRTGRLLPGGVSFYFFTEHSHTRVIANLATKDNWTRPSQFRWITSGLAELREFFYREPNLEHIAIPALGCGLGGLGWGPVSRAIEGWAKDMLTWNPRMEIEIYPPK